MNISTEEERVTERFFDHPAKLLDIIDTGRDEKDLRKTLIVETKDGRKFVIKLANNDFTFPEKIKMWQKTVEEYRKLGCYCPKIFPDKHGSFPAVEYKGYRYIAFAEEYSKYLPADRSKSETADNDNRYKDHFEEIWEMTAKVAAKYLDYTEYPSAYCLFETFCPSDETDEVMENALEWKKYADSLPGEFHEQTERIWKLWKENRATLEKVYHKLPTSVFQADLNPTNILTDENNRFTGVIDFNLCGRDVFLNYLIRENHGSFESDMELIPRALKTAARYYTFSDTEKDAVLLLYRCIAPLWYSKLMMLKECGDDLRAIKDFLDKTEYYLTADIDLRRYME